MSASGFAPSRRLPNCRGPRQSRSLKPRYSCARFARDRAFPQRG
jgi:hypothetical protein